MYTAYWAKAYIYKTLFFNLLPNVPVNCKKNSGIGERMTQDLYASWEVYYFVFSRSYFLFQPLLTCGKRIPFLTFLLSCVASVRFIWDSSSSTAALKMAQRESPLLCPSYPILQMVLLGQRIGIVDVSSKIR